MPSINKDHVRGVFTPGFRKLRIIGTGFELGALQYRTPGTLKLTGVTGIPDGEYPLPVDQAAITGPFNLGFGRRSAFVLVVNVANLPLNLTEYEGDPAEVKLGGEGELTITITSGGTDIPLPNVPAAVEP